MAQRYAIRRTRHKPLVFSGEILAEVSTRNRRDRWTELRLYRTTRSTAEGDAVETAGTYTPSEGSYVAEQVGRTKVEGEIDRIKAWPCRTKRQVMDALGDGPLAQELYTQAGWFGAERVGPVGDDTEKE